MSTAGSSLCSGSARLEQAREHPIYESFNTLHIQKIRVNVLIAFNTYGLQGAYMCWKNEIWFVLMSSLFFMHLHVFYID